MWDAAKPVLAVTANAWGVFSYFFSSWWIIALSRSVFPVPSGMKLFCFYIAVSQIKIVVQVGFYIPAEPVKKTLWFSSTTNFIVSYCFWLRWTVIVFPVFFPEALSNSAGILTVIGRMKYLSSDFCLYWKFCGVWLDVDAFLWFRVDVNDGTFGIKNQSRTDRGRTLDGLMEDSFGLSRDFLPRYRTVPQLNVEPQLMLN
jgi:hypothetical protein